MRAVWTAAALGMMAGVVQAQVVTAPPKQPPDPAKTIEKAPTPPPPPPRPANQPKELTTTVTKVDPDGTMHAVGPDGKPVIMPGKLRNVPIAQAMPAYKSLVDRDAKGDLIPLKEPVDIAALHQNPAVDAEAMAKIDPYLAERKARMEQLVAENVNVVEEIQAGVLNKVVLDDKDGLMKTRALVKPFMPPNAPKALTEELQARSLMTKQQADVNKTIAGEYQKATMPKTDPAAQADKQSMVNEMLSHTLRQSVAEAMFTHRALSLEAAGKLGELLPKIGLSTEVADKVKSMVAAAGPDENATYKAMNAAMAQMPAEKRGELLKAVVAARAGK